MRSLHVALLTGVFAALLPFAPAFAEWTPQGRVSFRQGCMNTCQGGDVTKSLRCTNYCVCVAADLEKAYPDMQRFMRLHETADPAYVQRARAIDQACSNR